MNFTNLGGVGGKIYFLKNVNGLWLLRQCLDEWELQGIHCSLEVTVQECSTLPAPVATIDVDDAQLMLPGNTIGKMNEQLERLGHPPFGADRASVFPLANMILHSMAARYAEVLDSIQRITGKKLKRLFIVGGGSQNDFLNKLTARRTGLDVTIGATESTTIGNFAVQMATLEPDWTPANGVTAKSVARWAELLSPDAGARPNSGYAGSSPLLSSGSCGEMETLL
jgi:rhamnulokinase